MLSADEGIWLLDHGDIAGGGQRFALRLAVEGRRRGVEVRVASGAGPLLDRCRAEDIEAIELPLPDLGPAGAASIPAAIGAVRRFLRDAGPGGLVVGNHPRAHAFLFAASLRMREAPAVVNVAHDRATAARRSARFAYRRHGALVAVGEAAASEYRRALPGVEVGKANNFLAEDYFREARRGGGPGGRGGAVVGVLARMIPEKGIAELVSELGGPEAKGAWERLLMAAPFQDPAYVREVERRVAAAGLGGRVELLGEVTDVPGFLGSVDALVVPSTGSEAQPTVILEALAHGVPVILRSPLWSGDYEGLPAAPYTSASELAALLADPPGAAASPEALIARFGPDQAFAALGAAASLARARS